MSYIYPNFKTKKAAKEAIAEGRNVTCRDNTPFGQQPVLDGHAYIEGPHYPEPHKWYGKAEIRNGLVVKLT